MLARNPMKMIASPQMSSDSHLASVMTQFGSILQFRSGEASSSFLLFRFLPWHSRMSGRKSRQTFLGKTPDSEDFLHWNLDPNWNDFVFIEYLLCVRSYIRLWGYCWSILFVCWQACCPEEQRKRTYPQLENRYKVLF